MRLLPIIAVILAISIAIPAGLLLTGTLTTTQLGETTKERSVPDAVISPANERVKGLLPAAPEQKKEVIGAS